MNLPVLNPADSCSGSHAGDSAWLVEHLLNEQHRPSDDGSATAVQAFAERMEQREPTDFTRSAYQALLPATPPGPGQQYAFEVDLDRCSGCKACVTACHSLNGLDEGETWRDVGMLVGGAGGESLMQHVTTACHHCLEPACLFACPVNAYEKDPVTGIVKHFDDQCFGCQYCTLACPYEVPKFHRQKGIVRKCDMCSDRLQAGEPPACVQACPHQAISIRIVDCDQVEEHAVAAAFLPAAPDPHITLPTTHFKTERVFPRSTLPVDYYQVSPQHPHLPLVVMLVLTQLSVGTLCVSLLLETLLQGSLPSSVSALHALTSLGVGMTALLASLLHLGRPQYAFRALLGLGHSWLSREILAFGLFASLSVAYAAALSVLPAGHLLTQLAGWSAAATGLIAVGCSIMIYVFTQREIWSWNLTATRFLLTTALLGVATAWLGMWLLSWFDGSPQFDSLLQRVGPLLCRLLMGLSVVKLLWEAAQLRHLLTRRMTAAKRSALLLSRELSTFTLARFAAGILGGVAMPAFLLARTDGGSQAHATLPVALVAVVLWLATLAGELLERYLFFAAAAAPRMPGAVR